MIIAIDGPAGCGKSTVAKRVAKKLGWYFLNTGSFYRAYTLAQLEKNLDPLDRDSVLKTAKSIKLTVQDGSICIDGKNVESSLHTPLVDKYASYVSSDPRLREIVTSEVRKIAGNMNIVTEGRDTTTVIFPNADYKFFFDASLEERAKRRSLEQKDSSYNEVLESIKKRDKNDKAKNAIYIDTTNLTIDDVCEKVYFAMQKH